MTTLGTVLQNPILTPARIAVFKRMRDENHPVWKAVIQPQIDDKLGNIVYGNAGLGAVIQFLLTNDAQYANQAYTIMSGRFLPAGTWPTTDFVRIAFMESVLTTFWIWPGLTPDQQTKCVANIQMLCDFCLQVGTPNYVGGCRTNDTDVCIAMYFGLILTSLLFPDVFATLPTHVGAAGGNADASIGGLDATKAGDWTSMRNALDSMLDLAMPGGQWLVSSDYNIGDDDVMMFQGALAVKHITGVDHYPKITGWAPQNARCLIHGVTPDLKERTVWGDSEHDSTDMRWFQRVWAISCCCRYLEEIGDTQTATGLQFHFNELAGQLGYVYPQTTTPECAIWLDPYAAAADYRPWLPRTIHSAVGEITRRDGQMLTQLFAPAMTDVDHSMRMTGTVQVYDPIINADGTTTPCWPIENPSCYGGASIAQGVFAQSCCGCNVVAKFGPIEWAETDDYVMQVSGQSGPPLPFGSYDEPPDFVNESTTAILIFNKLKMMVRLDRMDLDDPRKVDAATLADESHYHPDFVSTINFANNNGLGHLKQVFRPMRGTPTVTPTGATWTVGGLPVRWDYYSTGGPLTAEVDNLSTVLGPPSFGPADPSWKRIRIGSDRTGPECILSCYQWGVNQVVPDKFISANNFGFAIGESLVLFSYTGAMPSVAAGTFTDYLIGTDATGKWGVTVQSGTPTPPPTPATTPTVHNIGDLISVNGMTILIGPPSTMPSFTKQ